MILFGDAQPLRGASSALRPLLSNQKVRCQNFALPCIAPPSSFSSLMQSHTTLTPSYPFTPLSLPLTHLLTGGFYCLCWNLPFLLFWDLFCRLFSLSHPPTFFILWVRLKPGIQAHRCFPPTTLHPHSHLLVSLSSPSSPLMNTNRQTGSDCLSSAGFWMLTPDSEKNKDPSQCYLWLCPIFIVMYVYCGCMDPCTYCYAVWALNAYLWS